MVLKEVKMHYFQEPEEGAQAQQGQRTCLYAHLYSCMGWPLTCYVTLEKHSPLSGPQFPYL